jgi:hypothetical protein
MSRNSEIAPSVPPPVQKVSSNLQRWGFWGFWSQLVLGIISIVTLLFSTPVLFDKKEANPANQFGVICAFLSIIILTIAVFGFYIRYNKIGKKIQNPEARERPKKSDTLQLIRIGLILNLGGMLLAILGAEALVGLALGKSLSLAPQLIGSNPQNFVNSLDLLIIQANTNTITAHFAGIVTSLLLLNRISS